MAPHRRLLTIEALVVGLPRPGRAAGAWSQELPNVLKVLILMALVVGLFGLVLALLQRSTTATLNKTHKVVQALPIPPLLAVHGAIMIALILAWSWSEGLPLW